jgi:hypothetical protein
MAALAPTLDSVHLLLSNAQELVREPWVFDPTKAKSSKPAKLRPDQVATLGKLEEQLVRLESPPAGIDPAEHYQAVHGAVLGVLQGFVTNWTDMIDHVIENKFEGWQNFLPRLIHRFWTDHGKNAQVELADAQRLAKQDPSTFTFEAAKESKEKADNSVRNLVRYNRSRAQWRENCASNLTCFSGGLLIDYAMRVKARKEAAKGNTNWKSWNAKGNYWGAIKRTLAITPLYLLGVAAMMGKEAGSVMLAELGAIVIMASFSEVGNLGLEEAGVNPKYSPIYASATGGLFAGIEGYGVPSKNPLGINAAGTPPIIGGLRCVINTIIRFFASKLCRPKNQP